MKCRLTISTGIFSAMMLLSCASAQVRPGPSDGDRMAYKSGSKRIVVAADGSGDYKTVQGAINSLSTPPSIMQSLKYHIPFSTSHGLTVSPPKARK